MKLYPKLDWITATRQYDIQTSTIFTSESKVRALARNISHNFTGYSDQDITRLDVKMPFYDHHYKTKSGLVISLSERQSQGVRVVFDGSALAVGQGAQRWLWQDIKRFEWRTSRVDVAVDIFDSNISIEQLWRDCIEEQAYKRRRQSRLILSDNGDTINIGSRKSDKYIRIYDKAKEQHVERDWMRLELEVKYRTAHILPDGYEDLIRRSIATMRTMIDTLPMALDNGLAQIQSGHQPIESPAIKPRGSKEIWLMEQILPALRKVKIEEPELYKRFVDLL